jgi:hypothetical protein
MMGASLDSGILIILALVAGSAPATAQVTEHGSVVATGNKPVQLTYHASAKNCVATEPPAIKIVEAPKDGALIIRSGMLTTEKFAGCGQIRVPAQVVFYEANERYVGSDHATYEAIASNGGVTKYEVAITVQPNSPPSSTQPKDRRMPL